MSEVANASELLIQNCVSPAVIVTSDRNRTIPIWLPIACILAFTISIAGCETHETWDRQSITQLFPGTPADWASSDVDISTVLTDIGGVAVPVADENFLPIGVRIQATRTYQNGHGEVHFQIDTADLRTIEMIDMGLTGDDGPARMSNRRILSESLQKQNAIIMGDDARASIVVHVGERGAVKIACDFHGCASALETITTDFDWNALTVFADADHSHTVLD
jgi:hypothetical protein